MPKAMLLQHKMCPLGIQKACFQGTKSACSASLSRQNANRC